MLSRTWWDFMSRYEVIYINTNENQFIYFKDSVTIPTPIQINIPIIIASVLGSILCTVIVGLIIFFIWKRRVKRKSFTFSTTASATTTIPSSEPVVAPALYDLSLSRQDSLPTVSYHLYDELP